MRVFYSSARFFPVSKSLHNLSTEKKYIYLLIRQPKRDALSLSFRYPLHYVIVFQELYVMEKGINSQCGNHLVMGFSSLYFPPTPRRSVKCVSLFMRHLRQAQEEKDRFTNPPNWNKKKKIRKFSAATIFT